MTRTVQVTAQLFQATRRMTVEPGQFIMVVADVVVGVYTGNAAVPVQAQLVDANADKRASDDALASQRSPTDKPVQKATAQRREQRKSTGIIGATRTNGMPVSTLIPVIHHVIEMLRTEDEVSTKQIKKDILGSDLDPTGWRTRDATRWLRNNGVINAAGSTAQRTFTRGPKFPESGQLEFQT